MNEFSSNSELFTHARKYTRVTIGRFTDEFAVPFDLPELIARVQAMLRRKHKEEKNLPEWSFGDIVIDRAGRSVRVRGKKIALSAREFDLLCLFLALISLFG